MVDQWRSSGRCSFRDFAGNRGSLELQSTPSAAVSGISAGLRAVADGRLRIGLPGRQFRNKEGASWDFDACWDVQNADDDKLDPVFWDFSRGRAAQKQRFLGEFFPAQLPEGATGRAFIDFFQVNKLSGEPKGIMAVRLGRGGRK
jgi:hypothetical protein